MIVGVAGYAHRGGRCLEVWWWMLWVVRVWGWVCDDLDAGLTGEINGFEDLPGGSEPDKQRDLFLLGIREDSSHLSPRSRAAEKILRKFRSHIEDVGIYVVGSPRRFG